MKTTNSEQGISRRTLLKSGASALVAMTIMPTGMIIGAGRTWAASPAALQPATFASLVQICRDIYPHDQLVDAFYAKVVEGFDAGAADSAEQKAMLEDGVAGLNSSAQQAHGVDYADVGWEAQRVDLLESIQSGGFFQKLRGAQVTGIYNNKDVWPIFGYEGESASKGGYIDRGFNDIDWLDQA